MSQAIYFIKNNWLPLAMVLIPSGLFLGPMPYNSMGYYSLLVILTVLSFIKKTQVSKVAMLFLLVCALSIVLGNASPIFKSWGRLGLFSLLVFAYFPVFQSKYSDRLHSKAFLIMLVVIVFTSVGSFAGYFLGINYMTKAFSAFADSVTVDTTGWFGGLTYQSMMLGPICAISLTILIWLLIEKVETKKMKWLVGCLAFMALCCMMLTASRSANAAGAFGVGVVLLVKYRNRIGKILQIGIMLALLSVVLSPLYMPYADKVLSKQRDNEVSGSTFASRQDRWQHRLQEFSEYPVFGYGFAAIDTNNYGEYMPSTGIIEPGSSWLAILSMTGIVGFALFLTLLLSTVSRLYALFKENNDDWALLHLGILAVFVIHFIAEGYVFSGGGALCFLFWFFFGCAYSYARNDIPYSFSSKEITYECE